MARPAGRSAATDGAGRREDSAARDGGTGLGTRPAPGRQGRRRVRAARRAGRSGRAVARTAGRAQGARRQDGGPAGGRSPGGRRRARGSRRQDGRRLRTSAGQDGKAGGAGHHRPERRARPGRPEVRDDGQGRGIARTVVTARGATAREADRQEGGRIGRVRGQDGPVEQDRAGTNRCHGRPARQASGAGRDCEARQQGDKTQATPRKAGRRGCTTIFQNTAQDVCACLTPARFSATLRRRRRAR